MNDLQGDRAVCATVQRRGDTSPNIRRVRFDSGKVLGLALLLFVLPIVVLSASVFYELFFGSDAVQAGDSHGGVLSERTWVIASAITLSFGIFACSIFTNAAVIFVAYRGLQSQRASIGSGIARAWRVFLPNIALMILMGPGIGLGLLLLVVPGLILLVRWSVAVPALIIKRTSVIGSLARSRDLTCGRRGSVLGLLVLMVALEGVLSYALGNIATLLGAVVTGEPGVVLQSVVSLVGTGVTFAFGAASVTALYVGLVQAENSENYGRRPEASA